MYIKAISPLTGKISKHVFDILKNFTIMYKETKSIATKLQILPILEHLLQLMDDLKRYFITINMSFAQEFLTFNFSYISADFQICSSIPMLRTQIRIFWRKSSTLSSIITYLTGNNTAPESQI